MTNDVESHSIWHNTLRYETGVQVAAEGIPRLLDLYDAYQVRSTYYVTGYMGKHFPGMVRSTAERGHEVASHGLSHEVHHAFDVMPFGDQLAL